MIGKLSNVVSSLPVVGRFVKGPEKRVLFVGLDNAGKTTLAYRLKLQDVPMITPPIGLCVERFKGSFLGRMMDVAVWDVVTNELMRPLLHHYFANTQGIVVVVDRTDCSNCIEAT